MRHCVRMTERNPTKHIIGIVPGSLVSGAESVLLRDMIAARAAGWTIRIACSDGPLEERLRLEGIERVPIPDLRLGEGHRKFAFARAALNAARAAFALRRQLHRGEIIVANSINVLAATALVSRKRRVLYIGHDVLIRKDRLLLLRLVRSSVHIAIAVSEVVARTIRTSGITTVVVHNGTTGPVRRATSSDRSSDSTIGIAAVITPWKGHTVLLDALALMHNRDVHLEIMGGVAPKDTKYAAELRARVAGSDLEGRVHFLGHVAEPLDRMRTWTIAVSASVDPEAGPLTALEALSIGVPFVATNHGGMVEIMGAAGILVPPSDPLALAAAIDDLLDDRERRVQCCDAGPRQIVEHHLTLDDHARRMLDIFESVYVDAL